MTLVVVLMALQVASARGASPPVPPRGDSMNEPVYLVHGYGDGTDCRRRWRGAMTAWRAKGWTGAFHTVAYYAADRNCGVRIAAGDRNTWIAQVARGLAWDIYRRYSRRGVSVDVVGHSMGGLIAMVAIGGVQDRWRGFPPYLYVEDAVTLGTPFRGVTAPWVSRCTFRQCVQMRPGSTFLAHLPRARPQSAQRTDWTLIGSRDDKTVSAESATGMQADHKVVYDAGTRVGHSGYDQSARNHSWRLSYWNTGDTRGWRHSIRGRAPVIAAGAGIHRASRW